MCGALNYAGCFAEVAGSVDGVNGWEDGLRDGLGYNIPVAEHPTASVVS